MAVRSATSTSGPWTTLRTAWSASGLRRTRSSACSERGDATTRSSAPSAAAAVRSAASDRCLPAQPRRPPPDPEGVGDGRRRGHGAPRRRRCCGPRPAGTAAPPARRRGGRTDTAVPAWDLLPHAGQVGERLWQPTTRSSGRAGPPARCPDRGPGSSRRPRTRTASADGPRSRIAPPTGTNRRRRRRSPGRAAGRRAAGAVASSAADGLLQRADRVLLEAVRQREVEDHLGVRRALDLGEEGRVEASMRSRRSAWKSPT